MLLPLYRGNCVSESPMVDRLSDSQVKRAHKAHIDPWYGSNLLHGLESLLGLDLDHGQQAGICLLEILCRARHRIKPLHGQGRPETATA